MPGFGQVDYGLVRPLTTGMERMESLGRMQTQNEQRMGMQQNRQMGRAEYERDLAQVKAVKQAVIDNSEGNKLNEDGFVQSLYGIDPKLAMEAQRTFAAKKAGNSANVWEQKGKVGGQELVDANSKMLDQYLEAKALTPEEHGAFNVLNKSGRGYDVTDWLKGIAQTRGKGYAGIAPKVDEEEQLRPGKAATAGAIAAAGTQARINTEAALAPVTAQTEGIIAGGRAKGVRDAGVTLSEAAAERLGDFDASLAQLKTLSGSYSNPDAPQGPIAQLRKANPYDWQAQAKQQLVAATKQMVGKALESGVLRKEDEEKYSKILPMMGDRYETAVQKTKNLETMLGNARAAKVSALGNAGYDVSKFRKQSDGKDDFDNLWGE